MTALVSAHGSRSLRIGLVALGLAAMASGARAQAQFHVMGDLPGSPFKSKAVGISGDGSVAVGDGVRAASTYEAATWTSGAGIVGIGQLPGAAVMRSLATDADFSGSVVVGGGLSALGGEAFRWTAGGGMVGLGDLPGGGFSSHAFGISSDGTTIVGLGESAQGFEAFRWTAGAGMVGLGHLPSQAGLPFSQANATSSDGSVVVGSSTSGASEEAFRWTASGGMVGLGQLPGGSSASKAFAVSADGSTVVGFARPATGGLEAVLWTQASGMTGLGALPAASPESVAWGISADGSRVVGESTTSSGGTAVFWTPAGGIVDLRLELIAAGVPGLANWQLQIAFAVSDDGTVIVGSGLNPLGQSEGWIAVLPNSGGPTTTYCTAKTNSLGCVPAIGSSGAPSATNTGPFVVSVTQVRNNKPGLFLYKANGAQAAVPFQGGTLCVGPGGIKRTPASSAGGNPGPANDCSGTYVLDFNAFAAGLAGGNPDPALSVMGNVYHAQTWGRDQGFPAPANTTLSDGLEVTVGA